MSSSRFAALAFIAALGLSQTVLADTAPLPVGDHRYSVTASGMGVGTLSTHMVAEGTPGCYRTEGKTKPTSMMSMIYGSPSTVDLFCIVDGQVRPSRAESDLPNDASQSYTLDFDWKKMTVTDNKGQVRTIPADAVDPISIQPAVRLWARAHAADATPPIAQFTLVDQKNLTHYQFRVAGHEKITTPAGSFDTLKLERIDDPKKAGHYWLAVEKDYMPVVIEQQNGNRPLVRFELLQ